MSLRLVFKEIAYVICSDSLSLSIVIGDSIPKQMQRRPCFVVIALLLLCSCARAQNNPSCYVTSKIAGDDLTTQRSHPYVNVVVEFPGTYTVTGDTGDARDFYRSAFHFYNASNDVQLFPNELDPTVSSALGVTSLRFAFYYLPSQVGSVKLKYTQQLCQTIRLRFNDTALTSLDLTCAPKKLNSAYMAVRHSSYISVYFSKPVKPCHSNGTDIILNSWFSLASVTCSPMVSECLSMADQGPCIGAGLLPLNDQRMVYTCLGNTNFSSSMTRATYTILENQLCDVGDNHTVSSYGQGETYKLTLFNSLDLDAFDGFKVIAQPQVADPTLYDRILVDIGYPVSSFANFSANTPYIYVKYQLDHAAVRCTASYLLADTLAVFACPVFRPLGSENLKWVWVGNLIHKIPGSNALLQQTLTHDDELDGAFADSGVGFTSPRAYRITGFYWIGPNTVRFDVSHALRSLPPFANFRVLLTSGAICYNASNITRVSGLSNAFYLNFNAANTLPDPDDVPLSAYHEANSLGSNQVHIQSELKTVEDELPSTSTTADPEDLSNWNYTVWIAGYAAIGLIGLVFVYKVGQYAMDSGKSSKRRKGGYERT